MLGKNKQKLHNLNQPRLSGPGNVRTSQPPTGTAGGITRTELPVQPHCLPGLPSRGSALLTYRAQSVYPRLEAAVSFGASGLTQYPSGASRDLLVQEGRVDPLTWNKDFSISDSLIRVVREGTKRDLQGTPVDFRDHDPFGPLLIPLRPNETRVKDNDMEIMECFRYAIMECFGYSKRF